MGLSVGVGVGIHVCMCGVGGCGYVIGCDLQWCTIGIDPTSYMGHCV